MPPLSDVVAEQGRLAAWAERKDDRGAPSPTSLAREYRAAIVRGRTEQLQVTREHVNRIMRTYESAGKSLQAQVTGTPEWMTGHEGALDQAQLRTLMRSIDGILTGLQQDYAGLLDVGMLDVAQVAATRESAMQSLGLVPANDPDLMASMQRKFELSDGSSAAVQFGRVAEGAVNALAQRYYGDGLKLSERLGALTDATRQAIEDTLIQGVTEQVSATEMADRLEKLFIDVKSESPAFRAWRIARTEIAQAHREAHIQSVVDQRTGLKRGYVEAVGYRLSLSHPEPDICCRAGAVITTDNGPVAIENIRAGDRVLTHRGRYRKVTRLYRRSVPSGSMVHLQVRVGNSRTQGVVLTRNHPVLTPGGWLQAGALNTEDRAIGLRLSACGSRSRGVGDGVSRASRSFAHSGQVPGEGTSALERCGEAFRLALRTLRTLCQGALTPTRPLQCAAETDHSAYRHRASSDCQSPYARRTFARGHWRGVTTFPDGASHSWDWLRRPTAGNEQSSTFADGTLGKMRHHTSGRYEPAPHGLPGSTHSNSTACQACTSELRTFARTLGRCASLAASWLRQSTSDHRIASSRPEMETADSLTSRWFCRTSRRLVLVYSYVKYSMPWSNLQCAHVSSEPVDTGGETVYNLGVAEDHSYIAGGIVVHNCDVWASDDSGLGAGNYEPGDTPTDHCFGMCWTITVIRDMPNIALPVLAADPDSVPDSQVRYYADRLGDPAAIRRVGAGG